MTAPASSYVVPLYRAELDELGRTVGLSVAYSCSCGRYTGERLSVLDPAGVEGVREHLVDEHPGAVPAGRCSECGALTWAFRAHVPELGTDVWLCEHHAPSVPTVLDQGGDVAGDQGPVWE